MTNSTQADKWKCPYCGCTTMWYDRSYSRVIDPDGIHEEGMGYRCTQCNHSVGSPDPVHLPHDLAWPPALKAFLRDTSCVLAGLAFAAYHYGHYAMVLAAGLTSLLGFAIYTILARL